MKAESKVKAVRTRPSLAVGCLVGCQSLGVLTLGRQKQVGPYIAARL